MTDVELNKRLKKYIKKNIDYYNEYEQEYLLGLDADRVRDIEEIRREMPDLVRQILEEIGYYEDRIRYSGYEAFIKLMDRKFGLDKNIVEIGGGVIPTLSHKISLRQKSGTITIYDPLLSDYYESNDRFVLKKEKFNRWTNVKDADLLFGFMPCEATQSIIECAIDNNKDFIIAMCEGGPHGDEFDYFESVSEWLCSMMNAAERGIEKNNMGKLKVLSFRRYLSNYPVIYNERSK